MSSSELSRQAKMVIYEAREELSPYLKHLDLEKLSKHNRGCLDYSNDLVRCLLMQKCTLTPG